MPETSVYMQKGGPDCSILKGVSENGTLQGICSGFSIHTDWDGGQVLFNSYCFVIFFFIFIHVLIIFRVTA